MVRSDFLSTTHSSQADSPELSSGHVLNEFVRGCVVRYLDDDNAEVRERAAATCCRLFAADPICAQTSAHSIEIISDVLQKLLTVAIADPEPRVRQTVLAGLSDKFDRHLAQPEHVHTLFVALNDAIFGNRELAIDIINRLADLNPAYVMPSLRKVLIQMISSLEFSTRGCVARSLVLSRLCIQLTTYISVRRQKEETTKLLIRLIRGTAGLVTNYTEELLDVLLRCAHDPATTPAVAANVIACLGELAVVAGHNIGPRVGQIMGLVIDTLQDQSLTAKRDAALITLGQVASFTGAVLDPYTDYPELLVILSRLVNLETDQKIRRETIKVIGILGALDPYRRKVRRGRPACSKGEPALISLSSQVLYDKVDVRASELRSAQTDISLLMNLSGGQSNEDYFQSVAFNSLVNIILDPALNAVYYTKAMDAIIHIFLTQGLKCVQYLPQVRYRSAFYHPLPPR